MKMTTISSPTSAADQPGAPMSNSQIKKATELFEIRSGAFVSHATLIRLLPDVRTALFFAKAYKLDYNKLAELLRIVVPGTTVDTLLNRAAEHSADLQDYLIEVAPSHTVVVGGPDNDPEPAPDTELLSQLIEEAAVEVAKSITDVADKIARVLESMPSKFGEMTFKHLRELNRQRNSIGKYDAQIKHAPVPPRLVILDVSGSMTQPTIRKIVDEVVGMAYSVEASLAIVSDNCFFWEAGTFDTQDVLDKAEYKGTHYEQLTGVLDRDWDTVITVADYDSSLSAKEHLAWYAMGRVGTVLDISLVNRPTFLAECVAQLARELKPLLVASTSYVLHD